MSLFAEIARELIGMFVADARLTACVLALVGAAAVLLGALHVAPLAVGAVLLLGGLVILVAVVFAEAARKRSH